MACALTRQEPVEMMDRNPSDRRLSRRRLGQYENIVGPAIQRSELRPVTARVSSCGVADLQLGSERQFDQCVGRSCARRFRFPFVALLLAALSKLI